MIDYAKLAEEAANEGADQTQVKKGGSFEKRPPPPAGPCLLRLVGYIELGKQPGTYLGKPTSKEQVMLQFEVHGKNYPPIELEDGTKIPIRVEITENLSQGDKARWPILFNKLNYAGKVRHCIGLLGQGYKGRIVHRKYKAKGDPAEESGWTGVAVELFDKKTKQYTIEAPRYEEMVDGEPTGNLLPMNVPPAIGAIRGFLFNKPSIEMWNSLFIEGEYPERKDEKTGEVVAPAKSKNYIQIKVKGADNFEGSPMHTLLLNRGEKVDLGVRVEKPAAAADKGKVAPDGGDALDGMDDDIPF